jgi:hypothetical protein
MRVLLVLSLISIAAQQTVDKREIVRVADEVYVFVNPEAVPTVSATEPTRPPARLVGQDRTRVRSDRSRLVANRFPKAARL